MNKENKTHAIKLRKEGLSYKEIQQQIPVAKSTLSTWLSKIVLTENQSTRITNLGKQGRKRGNYIRQEIRRVKIATIKKAAEKRITHISSQEIWLIGISLYWAEGNKPRISSPSQRVQFSNSDPKMIRLFILWLQQFEGLNPKQLVFELYIHQSQKLQQDNIIKYWQLQTGLPKSSFDRIYFKRTNPKRKYRDQVNYGTVRITVPKSTDLNRKILALAEVICKRCGIV